MLTALPDDDSTYNMLISYTGDFMIYDFYDPRGLL